MGKFKDLVAGTKINRLTLVSITPKVSFSPSGRRKTRFECLCECGNITWLSRQDIVTGHTKSCGCYRVDFHALPLEEQTDAGFDQLYRDYKTAAKTRKLSFSLTKEDFKSITSKNCFYCGIEPRQLILHKSKNPLYGSYTYNGVDRTDSSLGYELTNCVAACNMCNIAKKDYSPADFLAWIEKVYNYQKGN